MRKLGVLEMMLLWVACGASGAAAQAVNAEQPKVEAPDAEPAPGPTSPIFIPNLFEPGLFNNPYAFPDIALDRKLLPELSTGFFTARPELTLILDWTGFRQDPASVAQVGEQTNLFEVRSASIDVVGEIGTRDIFSYKVGIEYNGFDVDTSGSFTITDFAVSFHIPKWRAKFSVGQMREDFGYEVIDSTAKLPQSERTLTPFTSPVNAGIKVVQSLGHNDRMTLSYGIFKNEWGDGDGKLAFAGRLTGLVIDQPDRRRFLHLGVGIRNFGSNGTLSYDGKPGVHAADTFVDTGEFSASGATHVGLEVQYSNGPWSILAEQMTAFVHSSEMGNPRLRGSYVIGSWFVTGENRPYDRAAGVVSRVTPKGRWGALELTSRLSRVDLDDSAVRGGTYNRLEFGANWWATTRWKLGLLAGRIWLDRFGIESRTDTVMTRFQWVY